MFLNNAEAVRLLKGTAGINEMVAGSDAVPVAYYDVTGRQIDGPRKGINIVKMSDGTAKKVLVK